jgi:hypothetical protein
MAKADLLIFNKCLDNNHLKESELPKAVRDKFRIVCYIVCKNNPTATTQQLCDKCCIILNYLMQNSEYDITVMKF